MVNAPATVWQPGGNNGEMNNIALLYLVTLSGNQLITLAGYNLVTLDSSFTQIPATVWEEDNSQ
jgi:hypothetical protein